MARELGCHWHTVNDAVTEFGELLVDDPGRIGKVGSLGLDEHLFVRDGERRSRHFVTVIADVGLGQLLDIVPGRSGSEPTEWLEDRGPTWCEQVRTTTLDLSATYRGVFERCVPAATLVIDPFRVVRHATMKLEQCRRRVQQETLGHRGRRANALYRCRRPLTMAEERLDAEGRGHLLELLGNVDSFGQVTTA